MLNTRNPVQESNYQQNPVLLHINTNKPQSCNSILSVELKACHFYLHTASVPRKTNGT